MADITSVLLISSEVLAIMTDSINGLFSVTSPDNLIVKEIHAKVDI